MKVQEAVVYLNTLRLPPPKPEPSARVVDGWWDVETGTKVNVASGEDALPLLEGYAA